ncbi:MAG TPA: hypothetical protein VKU19_31145 [Bryobacteraceae bacterium]|nr:hypothetical protein [Bryobacteraceae bacterium]
MDLAKVLQQLHEELENLNAAISSLERLQEAGKHRSREQEWMGELPASSRPVRKRKKTAGGGRRVDSGSTGAS